jgi:hypothetical protein
MEQYIRPSSLNDYIAGHPDLEPREAQRQWEHDLNEYRLAVVKGLVIIEPVEEQ